MAEGIPLHPVLAEKDVLSLAGQDRPLTELMRVLAAAYDYNLRRSGTVFLLVKRYSDPADLPSVTMGEWTRCLRQLARLTDAFNPHIDFGYHLGDSLRNHIVGDLAASFTAAQLAGLRGDGLRLRVLNPAQVALVRRFALYLYVQQRADQLRRLLAILARLGLGLLLLYGTLSLIVAFLQTPPLRHLLGVSAVFLVGLWLLYSKLPDWLQDLLRSLWRRKQHSDDEP